MKLVYINQFYSDIHPIFVKLSISFMEFPKINSLEYVFKFDGIQMKAFECFIYYQN